MTTHGAVAGSMRRTIESLREANAGLLKRCDEGTLELLAENERHAATTFERDALRQRVEELEREQDAMVEEAADEQTRSIKAALMDKMHDHALTIAKLAEADLHANQMEEVLRAKIVELLAEVERLSGLILDWSERPGSQMAPVDFLSEASRIRAQREECRHGGRQRGETPCPDCSALRGGGK